MDIVKKAREFAKEKHEGQTYGDLPYSFHLDGVRRLVTFYTNGDPVCETVAWLHDVIEDTEANYMEVKKRFGFVIADAVKLVTDKPGKNRFERHLNTYYRIRTNEIALIVKLCDRLSNMRQSRGTPKAGMYIKEYERFKFALYTPGHDLLWEALDLAAHELRMQR